MEQHLPELIELKRLLDAAPDGLSARWAHMVEVDGAALPIHVLTLGNLDLGLPAISYFAGVHGLERIGTRVLLVFLPLTLEMGSWLWVKKNPRLGQRLHRILRSHLLWLDFLARAACGWENWLPRGDARLRHKKLALAVCYGWP